MISDKEAATPVEPEEQVDVRSIVAWVLMVMFILLPAVGLALAISSIGWGLFVLGLTSGVVGYILGTD